MKFFLFTIVLFPFWAIAALKSLPEAGKCVETKIDGKVVQALVLGQPQHPDEPTYVVWFHVGAGKIVHSTVPAKSCRPLSSNDLKRYPQLATLLTKELQRHNAPVAPQTYETPSRDEQAETASR